ncbi:MAG: RHS repeat-associated core domain-containing protein [Planctomycetota bacterium]|nr:RHS repeat-associated core domain-containing protein [Planctomycetota bacterium]
MVNSAHVDTAVTYLAAVRGRGGVGWRGGVGVAQGGAGRPGGRGARGRTGGSASGHVGGGKIYWTDADPQTGDYGLEETLYVCNDANMNVTALVDATPGSETEGEVVERYMYDPYGKATVCDEDWTPREDNASAVANDVLYCGYRFDAETGLYHVRYRYYHPTLGRWNSRDPGGYGDGMSLFQYAVSSPPGITDPAGLYPPWRHAQMTRDAFRNVFSQRAGKECKEWMENTLVDSNTGQDQGSAFQENWRHYNRNTGEEPEQANRAFSEYLTGEKMTFDAELGSVQPHSDSKDAEDACERALQALGRTSHTWQDYFDHAARPDGSFVAWSDSPPVTGTPENMDPNLVPSSWGGFGAPGEHGLRIEAGNKDKRQIIDAHAWNVYWVLGGPARRKDAQAFTTQQFATLLSQWYDACECYCPPERSQFPLPGHAVGPLPRLPQDTRPGRDYLTPILP